MSILCGWSYCGEPQADLPFIRPHSIFILVRGSYEVFFFQRKVERTVEMLR